MKNLLLDHARPLILELSARKNMAAYIDVSDLPPLMPTTLSDFNRKCQAMDPDDMLEEEKTTELNRRLIHYTISGQDIEAAETLQLTPLANALTQEQATDMRMHYDFDSLIGFSEDLPFKESMYIYVVPSFHQTLTTNVHVSARFDEIGLDGRARKVRWTCVIQSQVLTRNKGI
jgi:hypothetical protein